MAKGDPEPVFTVDGHAIWTGHVVGSVPKNALVRNSAGADIKIKGTDFLTRSVDVEHRATITRPDDAVGIGDRAEFLFDTQILDADNKERPLGACLNKYCQPRNGLQGHIYRH
jgi:hypothetical protein